ncbi:MAG: NAD(P)-binding domain-containing protein [Planctomycetes bacterium]|nr:NAD(P)-binding domain-containing protein [Planctomycetota bacterium]
MSWSLLIAAVLVLGLAVAHLLLRSAERRREAAIVAERARAKVTGTHKARLQHPQIDLSRCIGCGTCVAACPEQSVLQLVNGQAMVVHGARCVGHGLCAKDCPTGAIAVELGDIATRKDIPVLTEKLESVRTAGVFMAGEATGYALIRTAISQGTAVADEVAQRVKEQGGAGPDCFDLVIIGSGPAGLACALQSKLRGTSFLVLEQAELGGTVAKYPRRKLLMTQPVELPLHGTLGRTSYTKEELLELWTSVIEKHELPVTAGVELLGVEPRPEGGLVVHTTSGDTYARNVCLALGRRGTPNKLGVPGEELTKVTYSLIDAETYQGRRVLVVGGGDSAVEAALGLAEQNGTQVTLSYRKLEFSRLRARNQERIEIAVRRKRVEVLYGSEVLEIGEGAVRLRVSELEERVIANDDVLVLTRGKTPFALLEHCGITFDPTEREPKAPVDEPVDSTLLGFTIALGLALLVLGWTLVFRHYYMLPHAERPLAPEYEWLRPTGLVGLVAGVLATLMILANLAYLARRSNRFPWLPGTLRRWMTMHVATGVGALLMAMVHGAMSPGRTPGGDAFYGLAILVTSGAIGRYLYSFVPRAANGRELELDEIDAKPAEASARWDRLNPALAARILTEVQRMHVEGRWQGSFFRRVKALVLTQRRLQESLDTLRRQLFAEGLTHDRIEDAMALARNAQRSALVAAHREDLRALLSTWRWLHRWTALAMFLLVLVHIWAATRFGRFLS